MKKYNKILTVIGLVLIMLFVLPFIINFIVTIENPFKLGFITIDNRGAWIGFFGSILGGLLTLFGVMMTLSFNDKQNFKNKQLEYKPFINICKKENYIGQDVKNSGFLLEIDGNYFTTRITIENSGNGDAFHIISDNSTDNVVYIAKNKTYDYNIKIKKELDSEPLECIVIHISFNDVFGTKYVNSFNFKIIRIESKTKDMPIKINNNYVLLLENILSTK